MSVAGAADHSNCGTGDLRIFDCRPDPRGPADRIPVRRTLYRDWTHLLRAVCLLWSRTTLHGCVCSSPPTSRLPHLPNVSYNVFSPNMSAK
jgi:hypothetical protein